MLSLSKLKIVAMEFEEYGIEELKCLGGQFYLMVDVKVRDTGILKFEYMLIGIDKLEWFVSMDTKNHIFIAKAKKLASGLTQVYIKQIQRIK